eukprot:GHVL01013676.1.p1 GENE.GHVL01013676.1~~GHVL01013676.1.p1  ORF type:complete len:177 (-),score=27.17 GHVL01013676.1:46-576(-)
MIFKLFLLFSLVLVYVRTHNFRKNGSLAAPTKKNDKWGDAPDVENDKWPHYIKDKSPILVYWFFLLIWDSGTSPMRKEIIKELYEILKDDPDFTDDDTIKQQVAIALSSRVILDDIDFDKLDQFVGSRVETIRDYPSKWDSQLGQIIDEEKQKNILLKIIKITKPEGFFRFLLSPE